MNRVVEQINQWTRVNAGGSKFSGLWQRSAQKFRDHKSYDQSDGPVATNHNLAEPNCRIQEVWISLCGRGGPRGWSPLYRDCFHRMGGLEYVNAVVPGHPLTIAGTVSQADETSWKTSCSWRDIIRGVILCGWLFIRLRGAHRELNDSKGIYSCR